MYKHLHMVLATSTKLFLMNLVETNKCNKCTANREETQLHMMYECDYVKPLFLWVLRCLANICSFKPSSNIKFLYFDNIYRTSAQKTICNIFIYMYVVSVWRRRKENLRIGDLKHVILKEISDYKKFIKLMPNRKFEKLSEELSVLDTEILKDL